MKEKWSKLENFHKSLIISLFYSLIAVIVSLILLLVSPSFIYGALIGIGLLYISYLLIYLITYRIKGMDVFMSKFGMVAIPAIRIILFLPIYLVVLFVINDVTGSNRSLYGVSNPINTFSLLLSYSLISMGSYFTIPLVEIKFK